MSETPKETLLKMEDIFHVFPDGDAQVEVLKGIDLSVQSGEMVAIMGPSGAGKSTLLKIAGGLLRPTSGSIAIDGQNLKKLSSSDLAAYRRRHIGFVFQQYNLIDTLTAAENVALPLELDGMAAHQARQAALKALETTHVDDIANRWAGELSGGQAQRIAVARALVHPGRLLLADEPTGALDSAAAEQIMQLLREQVDRGATCLMVTHDVRLAAWADDIMYMRDGQFVEPMNPFSSTSMQGLGNIDAAEEPGDKDASSCGTTSRQRKIDTVDNNTLVSANEVSGSDDVQQPCHIDTPSLDSTEG
ncbi:MAG: ABC transporter ATP-binding protein [Actinomycetaceae bacterium]|nr:ABC transporter ATP-binding protein [Actinomycetaceae bacterium]